MRAYTRDSEAAKKLLDDRQEGYAIEVICIIILVRYLFGFLETKLECCLTKNCNFQQKFFRRVLH